MGVQNLGRSPLARAVRVACVTGGLAAALLMPSLALSQRMTTPGQFSVGQSGGVQYSIAIQVPPGIGDMAPMLSLDYSSQSANGPLGLGWSLSGLSAITRCPRTMAQDGVRGSVKFDANDRFCMDGQRLILTSAGSYGAPGTEYRTELEQFGSIVASGTAGAGPASFVVKNKAGLTIEYGVAGSSAIAAQGKTSNAVWAVNKLTDAAGNYMTVTYTRDTVNGTYLPTRIDYTGNGAALPNSSVNFVTESRPDQVPQYHEGSLAKRLLRIKAIQTRTKSTAGDMLVKSYNLAYATSTTNTSRIVSVTECDGSATPVCLTPISFTPQATTAGVSEAVWPLGSNTSVGANRTYVGDFNGDGRSDVLFVGSGNLSWQNSTGAGFASVQSATFSMASWEFTDGNKVFMGDFNGDGLTDIATASGSAIVVYYATGSGFTRAVHTLATANWGAAGYSWAGDFDGDGRTDIATAIGSVVYVRLSNGNGFTEQNWSVSANWTVYLGECCGPNGQAQYGQVYWSQTGATWAADFNGDGKTDLVTTDDAGNMYVRLANANGTGFDQQVWPITVVGQPYQQGGPDGTTYVPGYWGGPGFAGYTWLGDFNGDGKADIATRYGDNIRIRLSTGTGFVEQNWSVAPNSFSSPGLTWVGDFDGDGKTDIASVFGTNLHVRLSNGASFVTQTSTVANNWGDLGFVRAGDFKGNGKFDIVAMLASGGALVRSSNVSLGDRLATITNGPGATTNIVYKSLVDASVYTKDAAAAYPVVSLQFPMQVVSQVDQSNGRGGVIGTQYSYGGLKADAGTGRGMLGFRWMKARNLVSKIETYSEHLQAWPTIGAVAKSETRSTNGPVVLLKRTTTSYGCVLPSNNTACTAVPGNRYFSYASSILEESWDLNSAAFPTVTTTFQYAQNPQLGDPTQVIVNTSDGSSKTTNNEYWPPDYSGGKWILGRLKKATVISTKP